MSRSLGKSRSDLYSHTHSRGRAPSLYARLLGVAVLLGLTGSPVLPLSLAPGQESNPERSESARDEKAPSLGEQISARISQLADSSYTVREEAGRAIVEFGSAALPELRRALGSTDAEVRRRAEELIGEISRRARQLEERAGPEVSRRWSRLGDRLPELGDRLPELSDRLPELADRILRDFDRFTPPTTDRIRSRMGDFDRQFEERIAELEERMRRSFERLDGSRGEMSRRSIEERLFGKGGFDSFFGRGDSGTPPSRVQIWRDGEQVFDSDRTFEFSEISEWGVALETLHPAFRAQLKIDSGVGLLVGEVLPQVEAALEGESEAKSAPALQQYDILLKLNDQPVTDVRRLRAQLREIEGIEPFQLELLRGGETVTVKIPRTGVR